MSARTSHPGSLLALTAREAGLVACRRCTRAWPMGEERCRRCGGALQSRDARSLSRVWAWWAAGLMAYVPANLYPMLETRTLFTTRSDTVVAGAVDLLLDGNVGIAVIILVASVLIPTLKFVAIAFLAISVRRASRVPAHHRMRLYEVVEYIGRWSMIDVFVVAILSSLVQFNLVASIDPGPAALTFALSVIFTMLSAQAFDPRLIWDSIEREALAEAEAQMGARTGAGTRPGSGTGSRAKGGAPASS